MGFCCQAVLFIALHFTPLLFVRGVCTSMCVYSFAYIYTDLSSFLSPLPLTLRTHTHTCTRTHAHMYTHTYTTSLLCRLVPPGTRSVMQGLRCLQLHMEDFGEKATSIVISLLFSLLFSIHTFHELTNFFLFLWHIFP